MTERSHPIEEIKAYIDGELSPWRRAVIAAHLVRCAGCRKERETITMLGARLGKQKIAPLSPALETRLKESVPQLPARPRKSARGRVPATALALAAACTVIWAGMQATRQISGISVAHPEASTAGAAAPQATTDSAAAPQTMQGKSIVEERARSYYGTVGGQIHAYSAPAHASPVGAAMAPPQRDAGITAAPQEQAPTRTVHREGQVTVQVSKVEAAADQVDQWVRETAGGYMASNQLSTSDEGAKTASLSARVPVTEFDSFIKRVSGLGDVKAKSVSGEDITERLSDAARAKQALGEQIASTEGRIRAARGHQERRDAMDRLGELQVEQAEARGRLKLLTKLGALATIDIELRERSKTAAAAPGSGIVQMVMSTAVEAGHSFADAARLPLTMLIWIAAYLPIWGLLLLAYRYTTRL